MRTVEALDEAILRRLAPRDVVPFDAIAGAPAEHGIRGQFGAVIGDDRFRPAAGIDRGVSSRVTRRPEIDLSRMAARPLLCDIIDDVEDAETATTRQLIVHEVQRSAGIGARLDQDRSACAHRASPGAAPAHGESLLAGTADSHG
jgi:hypothetical protein